MTINPSDLQAVIDRLEAGEDLSEPDLQLLGTALRSRQIMIATGEGAIGIGASADGATLVTGNGNIFINGANAESILNLLQERGLPDAPRVAPLPRVRLPDNFVPRPDALNVVKAKLLGAEDKTLVVSAIAGLGGIGKSVLATAIVLDREVQARFEDGILWVTLGQNPDLLSLLGDWIRELDKSREAFSANTLEAAARYLGTLLAERRMLLVVDDVWNAAHAEWFRVGGIGCRVLVTTREARLEGAEYHELDLMTEDEAIELVRQKLGQRWQSAQEAEVIAFANLLGRLPLALDLAANQVRDGLTWEGLRSEFEAERQAVFLGKGRRSSALQLLDSSEAWERLGEEEQRKYSLQACFNLSLKRLNPQQFEQFAWLGVLPEDVNLDRRVAAVLWNLSPLRAKKVLIDLRNRSFLTGGVDTIKGDPSYRVHDLMHDMARISIDCPSSNESNQLSGLGMSVAAAHRGFLERYRAQGEDRRWDKLPSDGYIHRHLTWHMIQAGWLDEIHTLMAMSNDIGNNAWFEACDRIGQPAIFVEDVARAWKLAEQMYGSEPTRSIGLQCRYALITATLNSLVANLPIRMMAAFVKKGFWTVEQAWAYVEQMQYESRVAEAIQALTPYLNKSLFLIAVGKAREMQCDRQAEVLSTLAAIDTAYFLEALTATRAIQTEHIQAKVLSSLAAINGANCNEILTAARAIQSEHSQAEVLNSLAAINGANCNEILTAARAIQDDCCRAEVFSSLAAVDIAYFSEALIATRAIQSEHSQARVLSSLAAINGANCNEILTAARAIQDDCCRAKVFSSLGAVDIAYFSEALIATRAIQDDCCRAEVLSSLAAIDCTYFLEALTAARKIRDDTNRKWVLSSLAANDGTNFTKLLDITCSIQDNISRLEVLISLTVIDFAYFHEALTVINTIKNNINCSEVLSSSAILESQDFTELLIASCTIQDDSIRARLLTNLVAIDGAYFSEALTIASIIQDDVHRAEVLTSLVAIDGAYFAEALTAARAIQDDFYRAKMLISLAAIDSAHISEALNAARTIQNEYIQAEALSRVAAIDGADFNKLLTAAHSMQEDLCRARMLISLAVIDSAHISEALNAARTIQGEYIQAEVLISLAAIDSAHISEALTLTRAIQDDSIRARLLTNLGLIDDEYFLEALTVLRTIQSEYSQADVLSSLVENAPKKYLPKILQEIEQITHKTTRARLLSDCFHHFPLEKLSHYEWCNYLHLLTYRKRSELMKDLAQLYHAILYLGGATAMRGVVDAMNEVCKQWR
jgi:NB-ARC domain